MHWIARAGIAVTVGCAYGATFFYYFLMSPTTDVVYAYVYYFGGQWMANLVVYYLHPIILSFLIYGILTKYYEPIHWIMGETQCRKCGYILRGISQPRCPECGHRI